jgi:hypothetical protein
VRKAGFFEAYRIWHLQVQPQFGRAATPTFLFLYIALPVMKQCRDELMDMDLWNPLGQRAMSARDSHISWKKYTEFMPRAQVALMEIPIYATYSLLSDLDALCERITTAEKRFREGPQKVIHTHTGLQGAFSLRRRSPVDQIELRDLDHRALAPGRVGVGLRLVALLHEVV